MLGGRVLPCAALPHPTWSGLAGVGLIKSGRCGEVGESGDFPTTRKRF